LSSLYLLAKPQKPKVSDGVINERAFKTASSIRLDSTINSSKKQNIYI